MPGESQGFADALTTLDGPYAAPAPNRVSECGRISAENEATAGVYEASDPTTSPRSPIMHFTEPPPFFRNSETSTTTGVVPRSRTWDWSFSEMPPGMKRKDSLFPGGRMMVETRTRHCYYRRAPDANRILIGARAAVHQITPQRAAPVMRRLLLSIFPQLEDVALTHVWKGNVAMTRVELPHLGRHRGLHYALGYSGSGVAMAPYLGFKIAHKLLGDRHGDTAFDRVEFNPIPLYWGDPWFLRCMEWRMRLADRREGSV